MAATSITKVYDALLTTTFEKMKKKLRDQLFDGIPFFDFLDKKGRVKTVEDGGIYILEPLMYGRNTTIRSFEGYTPGDLTPQDGLTVAKYDQREYDGWLTISRRERQQNKGDAQILNLLKVKADQLMMSFRDIMSQHSFAAQSGTNLDGLDTLIGTSAGTVGAIVESSNSWWAPQRNTGGTTAADLLDNMRTMFNNVSRNKTRPDLIVTTQTVHEMYASLVDDRARFTLREDNPANGFGVTSLVFNGVPLVWDGDCQSGRMYFLNTEFLTLSVMSGADFDIDELAKIPAQHAWAKSVYWMGNMTCSNRRFQGIISSIS